MVTKKSIFRIFSILLIVAMMSGSASARPLEALLGTGFTYQGKLTDGSLPANGIYDLEFKLYDALSDGAQVGGTVTKDDVTVTAGLFTVQLEFGDVFDGAALYLEVGVRPGSETGAYTALAPRQPLSATPYAAYASKAPWSGLTGVPPGFADGVDNNNLYAAGIGLTLGGGQFSLIIPYRLPQACSDGQVAEWDTPTSTWICANTAMGDITAVTAGTGLTGGGASGEVTLNADTTYLQRRVSGNCAAGSSVSTVNADGTVTCETDDNTTYTAGDGLELAGTQFKGEGTAYQNMVIVAKSGGDFTGIQAALDSLTDASDTNRYLVYVAPGVYTERVTMKPYVDIEGSGELTTKITFTGSAANNTGTVVGANDAELRFLTVENTGGATNAISIFNSSAAPRLTHVSVSASGGTLSYGVFNSYSSPTMTNVSISASGGTDSSYGVSNFNSSPTMTNVSISASGGINSFGMFNGDHTSPTINNSTISASGGTYNYGIYNSNFLIITCTVQVNNSLISGDTQTIRNDSRFVTRVGASQLSGGAVSAGGGTLTCAGVYDENYVFYASTCP